MSPVKSSFLAVSTFFLALPAFAQDGTVVRQQRFNQRDSDRNGFLNQEEYGGHPGNFRALDRDGDNRLSRDEFVRRGGDVVRELPDAFADLDLNADSSLSRSEWYGQAAAFDRVDRNNDGRIGVDEFRNLPEADDRQDQFYGRDANSDGVLSRREWQDQGVAFHRVDLNDDGVVSLREFLASPRTGENDLEARFDGLDRNNDQVLTRAEWRDAPAFTQADRNRNNQVSLWEFTNSTATEPTPALVRRDGPQQRRHDLAARVARRAGGLCGRRPQRRRDRHPARIPQRRRRRPGAALPRDGPQPRRLRDAHRVVGQCGRIHAAGPQPGRTREPIRIHVLTSRSRCWP